MIVLWSVDEVGYWAVSAKMWIMMWKGLYPSQIRIFQLTQISRSSEWGKNCQHREIEGQEKEVLDSHAESVNCLR